MFMLFRANNTAYTANIRITLMNELNNIDNFITSRQPDEILRILLQDNCNFKDNVNKQILTATKNNKD